MTGEGDTRGENRASGVSSRTSGGVYYFARCNVLSSIASLDHEARRHLRRRRHDAPRARRRGRKRAVGGLGARARRVRDARSGRRGRRRGGRVAFVRGASAARHPDLVAASVVPTTRASVVGDARSAPRRRRLARVHHRDGVRAPAPARGRERRAPRVRARVVRPERARPGAREPAGPGRHPPERRGRPPDPPPRRRARRERGRRERGSAAAAGATPAAREGDRIRPSPPRIRPSPTRECVATPDEPVGETPPAETPRRSGLGGTRYGAGRPDDDADPETAAGVSSLARGTGSRLSGTVARAACGGRRARRTPRVRLVRPPLRPPLRRAGQLRRPR